MIFFTNVENKKFLHRFFTFPHRFKDFFITPTHMAPCHPSTVICGIHWIEGIHFIRAVKVLFHWILQTELNPGITRVKRELSNSGLSFRTRKNSSKFKTQAQSHEALWSYRV